jgi:hypothetical protein
VPQTCFRHALSKIDDDDFNRPSIFQIWHKAGDLLQTIFILSSFVYMLGIFCWFGDELNERVCYW